MYYVMAKIATLLLFLGNECADIAARETLNLPGITEIPCFPKVLSNPCNAIRGQQHNIHLTRSQCISLARMRVGKAEYNTRFYYEKTDPPKCSYCDVDLSIPHLLVDCCPISRINKSLEEILDCSSRENIPDILISLKKHNIHKIESYIYGKFLSIHTP